MIRCACPHCRVVMTPPDEAAGKVVQCPRCGQRLQLPPTAAATIAVRPAPVPETLKGSTASQPEGTMRRRRRVSPRLLIAGCLLLAVILLTGVAGFLLWRMWRASPVAVVKPLANAGGPQHGPAAPPGAADGKNPPPAGAKDGEAVPDKDPLTEDQRVAWRKVRRGHPEASCYVAGYVTTETAWRMHFLNTDNGRYDWRDGLGEEFKDYTEFDSALVDARYKMSQAADGIKSAQEQLAQPDVEPLRRKWLQGYLVDEQHELADARAAEAKALKTRRKPRRRLTVRRAARSQSPPSRM